MALLVQKLILCNNMSDSSDLWLPSKIDAKTNFWCNFFCLVATDLCRDRLMEDVGVNYEPNPVEEMLRPRWRNARAAHRGDLIPTSTSADRRGADRPAPSAPANQRPPPGRASSAHRVPRRRLPSGRAREQRSAGPVPVDVRPPQWAKPYYKVVALVDGRPLSVYDGVTEYSIGQTIMHPTGEDHRGGLYVSPTVEGCLRRDMDMFPSESVLLGAPRAIAKVLAWNHTRAAEPVRYGTKLAFTYVRTAELLPYPASWPQNNDDRRVLQNQARPVNINEAEIRMPHHVRHDPSERIGPVSRTEALLRAQATTINLEEEVAKMERQLAQRLAGS